MEFAPSSSPGETQPEKGRAKLVARLNALIETGGLKLGDRLPPERQLATELGVSRASLREAIQHLVTRGRLRSQQGGGTFVTEPGQAQSMLQALQPLEGLMRDDPGYWQDVMEMRRSLEGDAAFFAALRATAADKQRLSEIVRQMRRSDGAEAEAEADAAFHMAVAEAAQNAVLRQVMQGLFHLLRQSISESLAKLYRLPATVDALDLQHRAILDAILAGDGPAARAAALHHLDFVDRSLRPLEEAAARQRRSLKAMAPAIEARDPSA